MTCPPAGYPHSYPPLSTWTKGKPIIYCSLEDTFCTVYSEWTLRQFSRVQNCTNVCMLVLHRQQKQENIYALGFSWQQAGNLGCRSSSNYVCRSSSDLSHFESGYSYTFFKKGLKTFFIFLFLFIVRDKIVLRLTKKIFFNQVFYLIPVPISF